MQDIKSSKGKHCDQAEREHLLAHVKFICTGIEKTQANEKPQKDGKENNSEGYQAYFLKKRER